MGAIDNAIAKLTQIKGAISTIGKDMVPFSEEMKKEELRLGFGASGLMPRYAPYTLAYKKGKSSYRAVSGVYDLFESGALADNLKATESNNIIAVGNSSGSPEYASDFKEHTDGFGELSRTEIIEEANSVLTNKISDILNV